jgi:hypothetical protein
LIWLDYSTVFYYNNIHISHITIGGDWGGEKDNTSGFYYDRADSRPFSVNTFNCLVPKPETMGLLGLGGVGDGTETKKISRYLRLKTMRFRAGAWGLPFFIFSHGQDG